MQDPADYVRESLNHLGRTEVRIGELVYIRVLEQEVGPGEAMRLARMAVSITLDTLDDERLRTHMR